MKRFKKGELNQAILDYLSDNSKEWIDCFELEKELDASLKSVRSCMQRFTYKEKVIVKEVNRTHFYQHKGLDPFQMFCLSR